MQINKVPLTVLFDAWENRVFFLEIQKRRGSSYFQGLLTSELANRAAIGLRWGVIFGGGFQNCYPPTHFTPTYYSGVELSCQASNGENRRSLWGKKALSKISIDVTCDSLRTAKKWKRALWRINVHRTKIQMSITILRIPFGIH